MIIAYYRNGHATNSSSSHSVVRRKAPTIQNPADNQFGWEHFTLVSHYQKSLYFALQAMYNYMEMGMTQPDAIAVAASYFPLVEKDDLVDGYIDRSSILDFGRPRLRNGSMADVWTWINEHIIYDNEVVVLGGNDQDEKHPLLKDKNTYEFLPWFEWQCPGTDTTFIRDELSGHLTLYNAERGYKVRLVGNNGAPSYSSVPELVDLSITDRCFSSCRHCYKDCNSKGAHADTRDLRTLAYHLGDAGVFEVAIGGGEPILHPDIADMLSLFKGCGVTPNFSTKETLFDDDCLLKAIKENCGSVAYSTQNHHDAIRWLSMAETIGIPNPAIHYIVGLNPIEELKQMIDAVGAFYMHRLVLLKFKPIGRGASITPNSIEGWAKMVEESRLYSIGGIALDSAMAKEAETSLPSADIRTLGSDDGHFSMYYDAVNHKAAPHSFVPLGEMDDCKPWEVIDWWKGHIKAHQGN